MSFPTDAALNIIGLGLQLFVNHEEKEWPEEFAEYKRELLEQKALEPIDRDMRKYDDALKGIHVAEQRAAMLLQREAASKGIL